MSDDEERVTMPFKFVTAGFDARFPNQNQTKHCWQNYVDYHKCINAKGEDFKPCRQVCCAPGCIRGHLPDTNIPAAREPQEVNTF
jgi:hypothetical protein